LIFKEWELLGFVFFMSTAKEKYMIVESRLFWGEILKYINFWIEDIFSKINIIIRKCFGMGLRYFLLFLILKIIKEKFQTSNQWLISIFIIIKWTNYFKEKIVIPFQNGFLLRSAKSVAQLNLHLIIIFIFLTAKSLIKCVIRLQLVSVIATFKLSWRVKLCFNMKIEDIFILCRDKVFLKCTVYLFLWYLRIFNCS